MTPWGPLNQQPLRMGLGQKQCSRLVRPRVWSEPRSLSAWGHPGQSHCRPGRSPSGELCHICSGNSGMCTHRRAHQGLGKTQPKAKPGIHMVMAQVKGAPTAPDTSLAEGHLENQEQTHSECQRSNRTGAPSPLMVPLKTALHTIHSCSTASLSRQSLHPLVQGDRSLPCHIPSNRQALPCLRI